MSYLPVIVGFGGINCSGRSSFHRGFQRLVVDKLSKADQEETYTDLAVLMGLVTHEQRRYLDSFASEIKPAEITDRFAETIRRNTLLRRVGKDVLDADHILYNKKLRLTPSESSSFSFEVEKRELPVTLPENWHISRIREDDTNVKITAKGPVEFFIPDSRKLLVQTAGQLLCRIKPGR
ncbi:MAG: hypothetical protein HKP58_18455 [Desulfatitalea sp.]|nr:hypothetical protein [Desulfatitalea sp.]NNK02399.1 hypothetical protein [Desulfatitalea sp.]